MKNQNTIVNLTFYHCFESSLRLLTCSKMVFREFMENSSIHGLRFIVDKKIHWSERIFWVVCTVISWYCSSLLITASWNAFRSKPISFVVETTYKDWKTNFPTIAICETENNDKIEQASDSLWTSDHDFNLEEVLKEIAFYKGVSYYLIQFCNVPDANVNCPKSNFTYYADAVRSKCDEAMSNCTWFDNAFDCCEYFLPIETELGTCYAINSIQGKDARGKKLAMISDRTSGPGNIYFNVHIPANVYVLGQEEVPTLTTLASDILAVNGQTHYRRHIAVRSIENDVLARDVSNEKRHCKYPDESSLTVYRYHSYSACTVQCRKEAQIAACGCTSFFVPNSTRHEHCDIAGLTCLHDSYGRLSVLRAGWSSRVGLFCDCQPSCEESDISVVADDRTSNQEPNSQVEILLNLLPSEKFKRNVVRSPLDLVVSIGGTLGLFVGASMLSFVEAFYFLVYRGVKTLMATARENEANADADGKSWIKNIIKTKSNNPAVGQLFNGANENVDEENFRIPRRAVNEIPRGTNNPAIARPVLVRNANRK